MRIRQTENDLYGVNASYSHLYDYYKYKQRDSAAYYARKSYEIALQLKSAKDRINAAERLVKMAESDSAKIYFDIYKHLSDSVRMARLRASNQYAMIRYEAEKSKKENLQLQKEVLDRDFRIALERILILGILVCTVIGIGFLIYRNNKHKEQLKLEAENKINENKLKTSKKVHDVVANGIYRVMSELENKEEIDREDLLDKLEVMYEKSRDISYDAEEKEEEKSFAKEISQLLKSFAHEHLKLFIIGNERGHLE